MARVPLSSYGEVTGDLSSYFVPLTKSGRNYKARASALGGNPSEILDVRDFGSNVGEGGDDGPALTAAGDYLRGLDASSVAYLLGVPGGVTLNIETPANLTAIRNTMWGIVGPGKINLKTNGYPGLDFTYSRFPIVRDLWVSGDSAAPPNVGVLIARRSDGEVADKFRFWNVTIDGEHTLACLFNYGSEDFYGNDLLCRNLRNDAEALCAIWTGYNSHGITSPYQTISANTAVSFNDVHVVKGDFRKTVTGSALFIERSDGLALESGYAVSYDTAAAVINAADSFGNEDLYLDLHCETSGLTDCLRFDGAATHNVNGLYFHDYAPQASDSIFKRGSSTSVVIKGLKGGINRFAVSPTSHLFGGGSFTLTGGRFELPDTTHLNNTGTGIEWVFQNGSRFFSGSTGFGQSSPSDVVEIAKTDALNNSVTELLRLTKLTSGTPAAGIGGGMEWIVQTDTATYKLAGSLDMVATDIGAGTEDFDFVFKLMKDGATAAEVFRISSKGVVTMGNYTAKGAEAFDGYITIKDIAGNTRKLMTCA